MGAFYDQFVKILDVTGGTSDQTSGEFRRPRGAKSLIIVIDVTAGAVLLLDLHHLYYVEGTEAWKTSIQNLPAGAGGITGVSTSHIVFGLQGQREDSDLPEEATFVYRHVPLFERNQIFIDHGNGTAATYKVWIQWR